MAPGARNKFGAPLFEPKVFREQIYRIKESTCDIVGLPGASQGFGSRGNVPPLPSLLTPLVSPRFWGRTTPVLL